MSIDREFFRQVMGHFATGVTIVTARGSAGVAGLTVNAFSSVSLDPPLVLVCIDLRSNTLLTMRESGAFAVNILSEQQEDLARCFATSSEERYRYFCHARYGVAATGSPILEGALGFVDARIVAEYPGGDHAIFVGEVVALGADGQMLLDGVFKQLTTLSAASEWQAAQNGQNALAEPGPLAYYCGHYRHLAPDYEQPSLPPAQPTRDVV
jgi:flavin reductase (DIM6/NTAB) family NADH-FMN oxidoreductase RutF